MTRVLTVTSWYPPHHYGGYELSCHDVMTRFSARGHDVRVLCGDERLPGARAADPDEERAVFRELRPHWREGGGARPRLRERVAIERHNHAVLARHVDEFQPDVVSVWHMVAISAGLLPDLTRRGVPTVYVVCDDWPVYVELFDAWMAPFSRSRVRSWAGRLVESATGLPTRVGELGASGAFCFVSDATRHRVESEKPGSYPLSTVVYSGIARDEFAPGEGGRSGWGWRLLYVGRLDVRKGVDTLVRALAHLPAEATLECCGRGGVEDRVRLEALARSLGVSDRVSFVSLEREELAARYRAADAVVFPSEWNEPFGLVPIEAMACATPVVATGVGGSGEFLRDGLNCLLFEAGDPAALAAAVRRLHDDESLRGRLVAGGLRSADELGVDRLADVLEQWHVAAAEHYAHGRPPDRVLESQTRARIAARHGPGTPSTSDSR